MFGATSPLPMPTLDYLFPTPGQPTSRLGPRYSPGVSPQSTAALREVLKDNHVKNHIFFNDKRFHNHAAHRVLAAWALGATGEAIHSGYERDKSYQKPAFESPNPITETNWHQHLGDERYFPAYVAFFTSYLREKGVSATIDEWIFSSKSNLGENTALANEHQPQMLSRFINGLLHPLIHTGYGAEFSLPGMVAEGLAQTAVHHPSASFLDTSFFSEPTMLHNAFNRAVNVIDKFTPHHSSSSPTPHALSILAQILKDTTITPPPTVENREESTVFEFVLKHHGKDIWKYVDAWELDSKAIGDSHYVDQKIEEIVWSVVVLYGVAGWTHRKDIEGGFNSDFFLMHLVTSSIFIPALLASISPSSQYKLLRAYFFSVLVWAVARGQPTLDIRGFYEATDKLVGVVPGQDVDAVPPRMASGNLWDRIIEEARVHHDEHLTKTIRSLSGWSSVFGTRRSRSSAPKRPRVLSFSEVQAPPPSIPVMTPEDASMEVGMGLLMDAEAINVDVQPRAWRNWKNGRYSGSNCSDCESEYEEHTTAVHTVNGMDAISPDVLPRIRHLKGSELLDGTLFFRVAVLTLGRLGWDLENGNVEKGKVKKAMKREEEEFWDFTGFFAETDEEDGGKVEEAGVHPVPKARS